MSNYKDNKTEIVIWDVQHGSSTYIKTPNHTDYLIDLGIGSFGDKNNEFSPIRHIKQNYNVGQLDLIIITHPDADHLYDILNLSFDYVKTLLRPHSISEEEIIEKIDNALDNTHKEIFRKYLDLCDNFSNDVNFDQSYLNPRNNGGVIIETFSPRPENKEMNNHSIVTILSYAESKILISGDNEAPSWGYLLDNERFLKSIRDIDIFVASHHGRESGYYSDLFDYFTPKLVIISDGPEGKTSVTQKYSMKCSGWKVHHRNGNPSEERKCLTTRKDGAIVIKFGYGNERPYIAVSIR